MELQAEIKRLPVDVFLLNSENTGMRANTNRGVRSAAYDYILQLQDDWLSTGPADFIEAAPHVVSEPGDAGLVRLRTPNPAPAGRCRTESGRVLHIYPRNAFAKSTEYAHIDNPHIK